MRFKSVLPIAIGVVLTLLGAGLAFGGAKLISLGGSWYYLLAGLTMAATGLTLGACQCTCRLNFNPLSQRQLLVAPDLSKQHLQAANFAPHRSSVSG